MWFFNWFWLETFFPAMTGRTRAARETKALRPPFQQIKNADTENNFSIATKKFLGKYGLQEDYT